MKCDTPAAQALARKVILSVFYYEYAQTGLAAPAGRADISAWAQSTSTRAAQLFDADELLSAISKLPGPVADAIMDGSLLNTPVELLLKNTFPASATKGLEGLKIESTVTVRAQEGFKHLLARCKGLAGPLIDAQRGRVGDKSLEVARSLVKNAPGLRLIDSSGSVGKLVSVTGNHLFLRFVAENARSGGKPFVGSLDTLQRSSASNAAPKVGIPLAPSLHRALARAAWVVVMLLSC